MGEPDQPITAYVKGQSVVVEIPISTLVFACENDPTTSYVVPDPAALATYVADNIVGHDEDEAGDSGLHRLLDELFNMAAEDDVIEIIEDDECQ